MSVAVQHGLHTGHTGLEDGLNLSRDARLGGHLGLFAQRFGGLCDEPLLPTGQGGELRQGASVTVKIFLSRGGGLALECPKTFARSKKQEAPSKHESDHCECVWSGWALM